MKKLFLIILFIICLPVIINAKSYTVEVNKTNNYMNKSNYSNTYKRYLLYNTGNSLKLGFSHGKVVKDGDFDTVTGFISAEEYTLTIPSTGTSYLYDGTTYWTLTGSDEKQTVFFSEPIIDNGLKELPKNTTNPNIDSRATVYVDPETNVTGTGKQTDPWIFVPRFHVTVKVSDGKHAKIREKETDEWNTEISNIYLVSRKTSGTGKARITVSLDSGYMLMSNDCNGKIADTDNINQKIFTVSNISRDTKCTLTIGTGSFKVKLGDKSYDRPEPRIIYFRHSDNYYSDENYIKIIRKIKIPTRKGYTFDRYEYNSKEIIDKDGNLKDKVSITTTNIKDENGKDMVLLTSAWHPNEYEVEFIPNGGKIGGSTASIKRKYLYERQYKERYASFPFVTRAGYSFSGWYTEASGGTKVTVDDILNTLGKKLYAHWDICKAGTYNDGSSISCSTCIAGTYSGAGASTCLICAAGTYSGAGASTFSICEAGTYSGAGASTCSKCAAGTYSGAGATSCTKCAQGSISNSNKTGCVACQPSGANGANGTTTAAGAASCNASCGKSNVSTWIKATWTANKVDHSCEVASCNTNYELKSNTCKLKQTGGEKIIASVGDCGIFKDDFGNYRYRGNNPCNYVSYNNETWRIIGVFGSDKRMKIMRHSAMGKYDLSHYESAYKNYYNSLTSTAKNLIAKATWYVGRPGTEGWRNAKAIYNYEKNGTKNDYVGLPNSSDYAYAISSGSCTFLLGANKGNCYKYNWMYPKNLNSGGSYYMHSICNWGYGVGRPLIAPTATYWGIDYINANGSFTKYDVHPAVFLKSNVIITSGNGTSSSPYQLSI